MKLLPPTFNTTSTHCLSQQQYRLSAHFVETLFIGILMPPIIMFGLVGNSLTLFVLLLNRRTKTRSDILLAVLASLDALFLLLMLPNSLAHFDLFAGSLRFRHFYFAIKVHLLALINQCSAAAIWIMLGICLERFMGISRPLSVRKRRSLGTFLFIAGVLLGSFLLTLYIHLRLRVFIHFAPNSPPLFSSYRCIHRFFCNYTQLYSFCFQIDSDQWLNLSFPHHPPPTPSPLLLAYVHLSPFAHALLVLFLPSLAISASNLALIWTLHKRDHYLALGRADSSDTTPSESSGRSRLSRSSAQNARIEHRVTMTMVAIVTSFTLTQTPSAIVQLFAGPIGSENALLPMRAITIFLVVFGKSINFVLFCLSSASFRSRLRVLINSRRRSTSNNQRSF